MGYNAVASSDELRAFAKELHGFCLQLSTMTFHLNARFHQLGDTWRDESQQEFAEEYEETMRVIGHFLSVAERQWPFLLRKADRIDDYGSQR